MSFAERQVFSLLPRMMFCRNVRDFHIYSSYQTTKHLLNFQQGKNQQLYVYLGKVITAT